MSNLQGRVAQSLVPFLDRTVDAYWQSEQFQRMGSEIERAFAAAILIGLSGNVRIFDELPPEDFRGAFLVPQFPIGRFRVDFLFGLGSRPGLTRCVVIECDGHDFHEKTKEQAARDKSRDRAISAHVMGILRFTGSEIYRDVSACAVEAMDFLSRATR